jgi:predicted nucleic acid-binding protein
VTSFATAPAALLDTNVVLDYFLARPPFHVHALALWNAHDAGMFTAHVSGITHATLFYVARKSLGIPGARQAVNDLLSAMPVCPVDASVLRNALASRLADYEDAVQQASAIASGIGTIITRDADGFKGATLQILSPADFLARLPEE